jgi:hypothetical protein
VLVTRVVVRHGAPIAAGDVVLASFRSLPDRLVVKRAIEAQDSGWWLASDNEAAGGDSARHGVADVHARVTWVVRRGRPRPLTRRSNRRSPHG